jgi:fumarylacetoacetate (FAA) hydrolase
MFSGDDAERRTVETLRQGKAMKPLLKIAGRVRIDTLDAQSRSIVGAIEQDMVAYRPG